MLKNVNIDEDDYSGAVEGVANNQDEVLFGYIDSGTDQHSNIGVMATWRQGDCVTYDVVYRGLVIGTLGYIKMGRVNISADAALVVTVLTEWVESHGDEFGIEAFSC